MLGLEAWPRPRGRKTWPRPRGVVASASWVLASASWVFGLEPRGLQPKRNGM